MLTAEKIIKKMIKDYATKEDNVFHAERLFVANTILNWAVANSKTSKELQNYVNEIEKHLSGTVTLYWEGSVIKVKGQKGEK